MAEEQLPLRDVPGLGMEARLRVDPGVVDVAVEHRALEALHDAELRIEAGFDRELPQQHLAERVDRLRAEVVDARELRLARAARRIGDLVKRPRGAGPPRRAAGRDV